MIPRLIKEYFYIFYLYFFSSILVQIVIFLITFTMVHELLTAFIISLLYVIHVTTHEFGHVLFLKTNNIPYKIRSGRFSINVYFSAKKIKNINLSKRILITIGGSLFSIILDLFLIMVIDATPTTYFAILLILVEFLNLIFGQDSRVLEHILKERFT